MKYTQIHDIIDKMCNLMAAIKSLNEKMSLMNR